MLLRDQTASADAILVQAPVPPPPEPPSPEPPSPEPRRPTPQPGPGPIIPDPIAPGPGPDIQPPLPVPADMPPPMARRGAPVGAIAKILLAAFAFGAWTGSAHAQPLTPPGTPPGNTAPVATSPATPPEITPGHPGGGRPDLSASEGVIRPPRDIGDSGINQRVPAAGTMPVIPPPGTPGGNQEVKPK